MKQYTYFGRNAQGVMVQLFQATAEEKPAPEAIDLIYAQMVAKAGLGIPRPTHYTVAQFHELPTPPKGAKKASLLVLPKRRNGAG